VSNVYTKDEVDVMSASIGGGSSSTGNPGMPINLVGSVDITSEFPEVNVNHTLYTASNGSQGDGSIYVYGLPYNIDQYRNVRYRFTFEGRGMGGNMYSFTFVIQHVGDHWGYETLYHENE
jgi:hypothetical protein